MGDNRKKTRGRLRPWSSCGHKGWGVVCHRCEQAVQLEERANNLAIIVKNKGNKFPEYVLSETQEDGTNLIHVKGGGRRFTAVLSGHKVTVHSALADLAHKMREYATHLKGRPGEATKKLVVAPEPKSE